MVTTIVFAALIGTLQFNSAISAAINYEPIKITVNENFNAQPGQISPELQEPAVVHQGANFYFKPQLNLSPSFMPSHIEALMSLVEQHHHTCAKDNSKVFVEKDKLIEILKPFMHPLSDISKESLSEIALEEKNNVEIVKPIIITEDPEPVTPEILVISKAPMLKPSSFNGAIPTVGEEDVKIEESIILEKPTGVFPTISEIAMRPITEPIINYVEPKSMTSGLVVIPEAPALPPVSFNGIPHNIEDEVNKEESIILEETTGVFPAIPEIDVRPIAEPIINYVEPKTMTSGFLVIPEAPELTPLSFIGIPPIVEEEVKKGESVILEESTGVFTNIPEIGVRPTPEQTINYEEPKPMTSGLAVIPEAPVLPPLSLNDIHVIEEEAKIEEPIAVNVEPKSAIQKLVAIPEAPILPSLSLHDISSIIEEEVKKEESMILEEPKRVFPAIPKIDVRPIAEPVINYVEPKSMTSEFVVMPKAPELPPLSFNGIPSIVEGEVKKMEPKLLEKPSGLFPATPEIGVGTIAEPINNYVELKSMTSGLLVIPEAPELPPLSFNDIPPIVKQEVNKGESVILDESRGVYTNIPEIAVGPTMEPIINYVEPKPTTSGVTVIPEAPVLPPLSLNDIHVIEEEVKMEEPIVVDVEPKPAIRKLVAIPEAPVLPSLPLHDISSIIEEEVRKEKSIMLEKPTGVFPAIPKTDMRPIAEPVINYVEPKSMTSGFVIMPEAPELPPLSFNGIPPIVKQEVNKGESVILDESKGVYTNIPEIAVRPSTKPIINYVEPKPMTSGVTVIPEAPVLPPLSRNDIHVIEEEVKMEEPIVVDVEPKPAIRKLVAIPEAPVLPSLPLHDISSIIEEEVRKEKSIMLEKPTGVFPAIPKTDMRPIAEPVINYVEPKSMTSGFVIMPEAPELPPLSFNGIPPIVEGQVKKTESKLLEKPSGVFPAIPEIDVKPIAEPINNYVELKSMTSGLLVIPEALELPPLSFNDIPPIVKQEVNKGESVILDESRGVYTNIPEIAVGPTMEPIINYVEPKPMTSGVTVIPEAPVLPPLSLNDIHVIEKEVNIEEPIVVDAEPKRAIQEFVAIPEAPVLPSLSLHELSSIIEEEVKKEKSITFEKPTGVFPTIPEIDVRPIAEPIINYVEPKSVTSGFVVMPEAPELPPLSFNSIPPIVEEEVNNEESVILGESTGVFPNIPELSVRPILEPIIDYVEPKPMSSELHAIPAAPVLPPLSFNGIPSTVEEEVKKEESILLEESTGGFPAFPEIDVEPIAEQINNYVEPKPITPGLVVIPEAPVLPSLSYNGTPPFVEEVKIEESIKDEGNTDVFPLTSEISGRPFPGPLEVSETAESFSLENNIFPIATEEVKIEVPILFEESIEVFPPIVEFSSGETPQESEITDSYVMEEVSQPNPDCVETFKETLPPTIISKPSNNLGVFSYVPFVSHLSNRAPKTKKLMFPKPASLERFLLKKHAFRLPVTPFPKLDLNAVKSSIWGNKKQFLYPTSYAHDVVEKRIAPNMAFKKQSAPKRVKIFIRSNVPKGPSYL